MRMCSITQNLGNRIFPVKLFVHDRLLLSPVRIIVYSLVQNYENKSAAQAPLCVVSVFVAHTEAQRLRSL